MAKKNWRAYGKNFRDELNNTSGIMSAMGLGLATIATVISAPYVAAFGGITAGGSLLYAAVKSKPEDLLEPDDVLGKQLDLNELDNLHPRVMGIGIVGATRVGKSTLLDNLRFEASSDTRTDELYAVVVKLQTTGNKYIALIDGAGQEYGQQFEIAQNSDFLTIVLDHNESDDAIDIDSHRLAAHEQFVDQIERNLRKKEKRKRVHFILNKNDLWAENSDTGALTDWFTEIVNNFELKNLAVKVTSAIHSNMKTSSVTKFNNAVIEEVQ